MNHQISMLGLFFEASAVVQAVMLCLLVVSVIAWTTIFYKIILYYREQKSIKQFEKYFWSGVELSAFYKNLIKKDKRLTTIEWLFISGFKEYIRITNLSKEPKLVFTVVNKAMKVNLSKEMDDLEKGVSSLASIGSISPYIGLFGTVWGIMNSFIALGSVQNATLNMVAPGIAEALIATAMGLIAAIPAVFFFNRFTHQLDKIENRHFYFIEEFSLVLEKQAFRHMQVVEDDQE